MSSNFVLLLANAGVLLHLNGKSILIDGLHNEKTQRFSAVSPALQQAVLAGEGVFSHIDYMLVTHDHPDHASAALTNRFLKAHTETLLLTPQRGLLHKDNVREITRAQEHVVFGRDSFLFQRVTHDGQEFKNIPNYAIIGEIDEKRFVLFGDAGVDKTLLSHTVFHTHFHLALLNFPFLTLTRGREIIQSLAPEEAVIFHLPFAQDDINGYLDAARRAREKFESALPPLHVLTSEMQKEYLL